MKIEHNNLYVHFVLTVRNRAALILPEHRIRVEKYITGIFRRYSSRLYAIYANPEHVHILVSKCPGFSEEELITRVAIATCRFINKEHLSGRHTFEWQEPCAAFSVSKKDVDKVCKYILNQPEYHRRISAKEEYEKLEAFYNRTIYPLKKVIK